MISNLQQVVAYTPIQAVTTTVKPPKRGVGKPSYRNSSPTLFGLTEFLMPLRKCDLNPGKLFVLKIDPKNPKVQDT